MSQEGRSRGDDLRARALIRNAYAPPSLPRRALGRTGMVLPVLGLGVAGPLAAPITTGRLASQLVGTALDYGVEVFDTAPFYGAGRAEKRLGQALSAAPHRRASVFTKGGTRRQGGRLIKDFTAAGLRKQIESSLTRLPKIDVFFLHGPSPEHLTRDMLDALAMMQVHGLFKHLGVAGRGPELDTAIATGAFDVVMAPVHQKLPGPDLERLENARTQGLGVVAIEALSPAAKGPRMSLKPADLWYTARALRHGKRTDPSAPEVDECLSWVLNSGLADIVLMGTTRIENLIGNIETARGAS